MESYLSNLLYLLWENEKNRSEWPGNLRKILGGDIEDMERILQGKVRLSEEQMNRIAEYFSIEKTDLQLGCFLEKTNILKENLSFLLDECEDKRTAREKLNVHTTTVSKWLGGVQVPSFTHVKRIKSVFGIQDETDLKSEPLFLSMEPVSDLGKKKWIKKNIDALTTQELRELYPALRRLLEERCT